MRRPLRRFVVLLFLSSGSFIRVPISPSEESGTVNHKNVRNGTLDRNVRPEGDVFLAGGKGWGEGTLASALGRGGETEEGEGREIQGEEMTCSNPHSR